MQRSATIAGRLLGLLGLAFLGLLVAIAVPVIVLVYSGFEQLEQRRAQEDLQRVVETLQSRLSALDRHAADWGAWDKSYHFAKTRDPAFPREELSAGSLLSIDLDLIMFLGPEGKVIWAQGFDTATATFIDSDGFLRTGFPPGHPLLREPRGGEGITGLMASARGPLLVAARPILTSARTGPAAGTLVMGRLLTAARVAAIGRQLHLDLAIDTLSSGRAARQAPGVQVTADAGALRVTGTYADLFGAPLLAIELRLPRDITHRGKLAIAYALGAVLFLGLLVLVVLYVLLHRAVVQPLRCLSTTIVHMGEGADERAALPLDRRDELGVLARSVHRMYEQMVRQARYDGLTHLLRRDYFAELVKAILERLGRGSGEVALLFVDLDGFKGVNDRFGHAMGDACLREVAGRLKAQVRGYDLVARLGGDEFVMALEGIPGPDEAASVARKLLESLARPYGGRGEVQMTASIGISLYPRHGQDWESLLAAADRAMYEAKQAGKNTYRFFRPGR